MRLMVRLEYGGHNGIRADRKTAYFDGDVDGLIRRLNRIFNIVGPEWQLKGWDGLQTWLNWSSRLGRLSQIYIDTADRVFEDPENRSHLLSISREYPDVLWTTALEASLYSRLANELKDWKCCYYIEPNANDTCEVKNLTDNIQKLFANGERKVLDRCKAFQMLSSEYPSCINAFSDMFENSGDVSRRLLPHLENLLAGRNEPILNCDAFGCHPGNENTGSMIGPTGFLVYLYFYKSAWSWYHRAKCNHLRAHWDDLRNIYEAVWRSVKKDFFRAGFWSAAILVLAIGIALFHMHAPAWVLMSILALWIIIFVLLIPNFGGTTWHERFCSLGGAVAILFVLSNKGIDDLVDFLGNDTTVLLFVLLVLLLHMGFKKVCGS